MRAITASGTVPSTIVGRMRCDSAERNAPRSPAISVSISRKPVTGSTKYCTAMRPETGVQAELHREQQNQQQSPPEDRHRIAGERNPHHAMIEDGIAPHRRDDAGRQSEAQREQDGAERKLDASPGTAWRIRRSPAHA